MRIELTFIRSIAFFRNFPFNRFTRLCQTYKIYSILPILNPSFWCQLFSSTWKLISVNVHSRHKKSRILELTRYGRSIFLCMRLLTLEYDLSKKSFWRSCTLKTEKTSKFVRCVLSVSQRRGQIETCAYGRQVKSW